MFRSLNVLPRTFQDLRVQLNDATAIQLEAEDDLKAEEADGDGDD